MNFTSAKRRAAAGKKGMVGVEKTRRNFVQEPAGRSGPVEHIRRCYCVSLWKDHYMGDPGCQLTKKGIERIICPKCDQRFDTISEYIRHEGE